jgi:NAD(P)-dependent dehydrogenase (short-subunit alcohol dehydrogenase family)
VTVDVSLRSGQRTEPCHGLQGLTVVLTGAAGGIGRALAAAFGRQGVRLIATDRDATALGRLVGELAAPHDVTPIAADLGSQTDLQAFAATVQALHGQVDVLVNNAGTEYPTPLDDAAPDAAARWSALLHNNVDTMVQLTRALLPLMPTGASVINQSSIWGLTGVADFSAYVASKHAVIGLTRSLAWELAPRGIRVNAVCPGWIRTDAALRSLASMAAAQGRSEAEVEREILSRQANPTMLDAADIAGVFLFLASRDARSLTGQAISASHGEVMN